MPGHSVSVVIPAYNAADYLKRAVASVLAQTLPVEQIVIVDDGSRDRTFEIANEFAGPVTAIQQANAGPAAARNRGAAQARGEWIAFLDADDTWMPEKIERQLALGAANAALIHCRYRPTPSPPDEISFADLWRRNDISTSTVLIRRDVFSDLGGFDEDPNIVGVEDYNLWLKVAAKGHRIVTLQEQLISYTPAAGSLTQQVERFARAELANLEKIASLFQMESRMVNERRGRLFDQYGRELLYYRQLDAARQFLSQALRQGFSFERLVWLTAAMAPSQAWSAWTKIRRRSHA